jgi:hypothetical protein
MKMRKRVFKNVLLVAWFYALIIICPASMPISHQLDRAVAGTIISDNIVFDTASTAYSMADLVGTWGVNKLTSGPVNYRESGNVTINPGGSFSGSYTRSDGTTGIVNGTMSISSDGLITILGKSNFQARMDAGKTVIVSTDTITTEKNTACLGIMTKKADSYSMADLVGTWQGNSLASGPEAPWWCRSTWTINSDGSFSASCTESDGTVENPCKSGTFVISAEGTVSVIGDTNTQSSMDAGKTVIAISITWTGSHAGSGELLILTKKAASYSMADLVGTWYGNSMASGPATPWWERSTGTMMSDGTFTASTTENDGTQNNKSGTFSISSEGVITFPGSSIVISINSGKTVMVYTDTWTSHLPGTTEMKVFTKMATQTPTPTACISTLDKNLLLHIPYLYYGNGALSLWVDLVYYPNPLYPALIPFQLANYGIISNPSFSCTASTLFDNLKIHISDVLFPDGVTHIWVDLAYSPALSTDGNFYWVVTDYGIL